MVGVEGLDEVVVIFFIVGCGHVEGDVRVLLELKEASIGRQQIAEK